MSELKQLWPAISIVLVLSGCSSLHSANSPDIIYDDNAEGARELQIPPDLTDVSNSEQFVLPGNNGGLVSRNTLLPEFDSVRFERNGAQSWLAFDQAPEGIWPSLLAFARKEKYRIDKTEPVSGTIVTQWRAASEVEKGGLLKNLISGDESYTRIAFRLERSANGTRLFARSQAAPEAIATDPAANTLQWPASSHNPEVTSELLSRLLVFLGVNEQKARGLISVAQVNSVIDEAEVQTNAAGSQLLVHRGFQPSFNAVLSALKALNYPVSSSDAGVGRIEFTSEQQPLVIEMVPLHISAVRLEVTKPAGARLPAEQEAELLNALLNRLV
ncbi:MAG: outer membrane protein assembly factor BamC [Granulosicoccus sp.]